MSYKYFDASSFRGHTLAEIRQLDSGDIRFSTTDGKKYLMNHHQDCCESVYVYEIFGQLSDLIGKPLTIATENTGTESPAGCPDQQDSCYESHTWTEYTFATEDHTVRIVWLGTSNGYYSESVQIEEV